jgi:hypothetical protein
MRMVRNAAWHRGTVTIYKPEGRRGSQKLKEEHNHCYTMERREEDRRIM